MSADLLAHLAADADTFIFFVLAPIVALVMVRLGSSGGLRRRTQDDRPHERADDGQTADAPRPARPQDLPPPRDDRPPGGAV